MHCTKTSMCLAWHVLDNLKKKASKYLPILLKCVTPPHRLLPYSYRPGSRGHHGGQKTWQFQTLWCKGKSVLKTTLTLWARGSDLSWAHVPPSSCSQQEGTLLPIEDRHKCLETCYKIPYRAQDSPWQPSIMWPCKSKTWVWENNLGSQWLLTWRGRVRGELTAWLAISA